MSVRVKILTIMALLILLMSLMMNYQVGVSEEVKRPAGTNWVGVLVLVFALLSLLALISIYLSWRDLPLKGRKTYPLRGFQVWAVALGFVAFFLIFLIRGSPLIRISANNTSGASKPASGGFNSSIGMPEGNTTVHQSSGGLPSHFLIYVLLFVLIAVTSYFVITYYRDALKKRERREMMRRARAFDEKLDELGLDMFNDPRDAVIGIYKNAVLWLEALGFPYKESWTHWEHAKRVSYMREAFMELTRIFEKAKYAPQKVTWEDAERALETYRKMRGELNV
ncbi:MAG: hypothetical protein PWQ79_1858 [Thermococcaceae archaeon]|nr:hypothetical protein [Thermococcaceae archaeon]